MLAWRIGHELLPTNMKIATINQGFDHACPRCRNREESIIHALRDCLIARVILMHRGLDDQLLVRD